MEGGASEDAVAVGVVFQCQQRFEAPIMLGGDELLGQSRVVLTEDHETGHGVDAEASDAVFLSMAVVGYEKEEELRDGGIGRDSLEHLVASLGEGGQKRDERGGDAGDEALLGLGSLGERGRGRLKPLGDLMERENCELYATRGEERGGETRRNPSRAGCVPSLPHTQLPSTHPGGIDGHKSRPPLPEPTPAGCPSRRRGSRGRRL